MPKDFAICDLDYARVVGKTKDEWLLRKITEGVRECAAWASTRHALRTGRCCIGPVEGPAAPCNTRGMQGTGDFLLFAPLVQHLGVFESSAEDTWVDAVRGAPTDSLVMRCAAQGVPDADDCPLMAPLSPNTPSHFPAPHVTGVPSSGRRAPAGYHVVCSAAGAASAADGISQFMTKSAVG